MKKRPDCLNNFQVTQECERLFSYHENAGKRDEISGYSLKNVKNNKTKELIIMKMRYYTCPRCGASVEKDSRYCARCNMCLTCDVAINSYELDDVKETAILLNPELPPDPRINKNFSNGCESGNSQILPKKEQKSTLRSFKNLYGCHLYDADGNLIR